MHRPPESHPLILLLDVDGVVLQQLYSREETASDALLIDRDMVVSGLEDIARLEVRAMRGNPDNYTWFRPAVVAAIVKLQRQGVRVVWNSSWLTAPEALRTLAERVGLTGVEFPVESEMVKPPGNYPISTRAELFVRHWKILEAKRHVDAGARVLLVDDQLFLRPGRRVGDTTGRLSGLRTNFRFGLSDVGIRLMFEWAAGTDMERGLDDGPGAGR